MQGYVCLTSVTSQVSKAQLDCLQPQWNCLICPPQRLGYEIESLCLPSLCTASGGTWLSWAVKLIDKNPLVHQQQDLDLSTGPIHHLSLFRETPSNVICRLYWVQAGYTNLIRVLRDTEAENRAWAPDKLSKVECISFLPPHSHPRPTTYAWLL